MTDEKIDIQKKTSGDFTHSLVKAGLSAVPVIGGAAAELFQNVVIPPLEKRRLEWMRQVGEKLEKLEESGLDLKKLQKNDQFISASMYASQIALKTHQVEKLEALQNAILNIAQGQSPDEARQHLFMNFIDTFTELHIRILKVFQSPKLPPDRTVGGLSGILEYNLPDTKGHSSVYEQIWKDLGSKGLVKFFDSRVVVNPESVYRGKLTTDFGDSFLDFITRSDSSEKFG